jgi:ribosomal-protein-serine acetyltransferase
MGSEVQRRDRAAAVGHGACCRSRRGDTGVGGGAEADSAWWRPDGTVADQEAWARFTRDAWENGTLYAFVILDPDWTLLGACSLEGVDRQRSSANLSYWVRTSATGRGVARTAARLLAGWGVGPVGLHRVEISMVTANSASRAAAAASGAVAEGVLRNRARWADESHDMAVFSFVPADFAR